MRPYEVRSRSAHVARSPPATKKNRTTMKLHAHPDYAPLRARRARRIAALLRRRPQGHRRARQRGRRGRAPSKSKTYLVQYAYGGGKRRVALGACSSITLAKAVNAAKAVLGDVAHGRDPFTERKEKALQAKRKAAHDAFTLNALVDDWRRTCTSRSSSGRATPLGRRARSAACSPRISTSRRPISPATLSCARTTRW